MTTTITDQDILEALVRARDLISDPRPLDDRRLRAGRAGHTRPRGGPDGGQVVRDRRPLVGLRA